MPRSRSRTSYVVHWSFHTTSPTGERYIDAQSQIFSSLDETLVTHLKAIRKMPNLQAGPVVEKVTHTVLSSAEKKRLEKMGIES